MNCRQAEHHISAERDQALDSIQQQALMAHIADCQACRTLRNNLAAAVDSWRSEENSVRVPDAELEWYKVRREIRNAPATHHALRLIWMAVPVTAAAAAVAIGLYVAPGARQETAGTPVREIAQRQTAVTASPESASIVYVDDKSGWTFVWSSDSENGRTI